MEWATWAPLTWNTFLQPRVSFFTWRLLHGKTPTQSWAQAAGFNVASRCCLCKAKLEITPHLLFLCSFVSSIWSRILQGAAVSMDGPMSPSKIWYALTFNSNKLAYKGATTIFFSATSVLWKCRNDNLYSNSRVSQTRVKNYLVELLSASLRIEKPFSGRPLQEFCKFLSALPDQILLIRGLNLLVFSSSLSYTIAVWLSILGASSLV